jgi:hypothetical protein
MSRQGQRRQSVVPLPIPSNLTSSEDDENITTSDIEIIESDNDQVNHLPAIFSCV